MTKRILVLAGLVLSLAVSSLADAHNPNGSNDCDTWSRPGHGSPSHHHDTGVPTENVDNPRDLHAAAPDVPLPVTLHSHPGHRMVRSNSGSTYLEVVGGSAYEGDPHVTGMGEGGYVQGRVDVPNSTNHVDFHMNFFGPLREPPDAPLWWGTSGALCVSVNNTKLNTPQITVSCPPPSTLCH